MNIKHVIVGVLIILFLIFIFQNTTSVTVAFLMFHITMPRALVLILSLAVGIIIGILLPYKFKKR